MKNILILGGTTEAARLSHVLAERDGLNVVTSLAGRTNARQSIAGAVRTGGFGGVDGLVRHLEDASIDAVIDATHPFATEITANAHRACRSVRLPYVRLQRPAWKPETEDRWFSVTSFADAARTVQKLGERTFLATGHSDLDAFQVCEDVWFLVRLITPPEHVPLKHYQLICERGPFDEASEIALLKHHKIGAVVSKNSGGGASYGKIAAARALQLPVIMIERQKSDISPAVNSVEACIAWVESTLPN